MKREAYLKRSILAERIMSSSLRHQKDYTKAKHKYIHISISNEREPTLSVFLF